MNDLTPEQKLAALESLLASLLEWRKYHSGGENCFPESFLRALAGLFPKGV